MSLRPKSVCRQSGCGVLVDIAGYCEKHLTLKRKSHDERRASSSARGYDSRWQKASKTYLRSHPLCVTHQRDGVDEVATVVDHIVPHRGDQVLFWDRSNWQALCKTCHDRKTSTEDGGFGRQGGGGQFFRKNLT